MNFDSHFEIGKDHLICEDYAMSGVSPNGVTYAIVSDGCSSSPDVDFGARVLAHAALQTISQGNSFGYEAFGLETIKNARKIYEIYPHLHSQSLDATLLVAMVAGGALTAYVYGDGLLYVKYDQYHDRSFHVSFPSGAPAYLSYYLNDSGQKESLKLSDKKVVVESVIGDDHTLKTTTTEMDPFAPVKIEANFVKEGDQVSVVSDGINSFRDGQNEPIMWEKLLPEFTSFKNLNGVFVKRRIAAFKRKCIKDMWAHADDISISSIIV